jgi:glucose-1-phosphate cytidylyltransferase
MKVVILAGGLGTRLSEETDAIPKPMVDIGGKPILWHIMKIYGEQGFHEFIVCLGYRGYMIKEFFLNYFSHMCDITLDLKKNQVEVHQNAVEPWKVTLVDTGAETMTGGRLRAVRDYLDGGPFFLTYGDGLANIDLKAELDFHRSHGRMATVAGVRPPGRFGVLDVETDTVRGFAEKLDNTEALINGGFFTLEPEVVDLIAGPETSWEREPLEQLARDNQLRVFRHDGFWQPMDTLRDKRELVALWESGRAPWKIW